MTTETNPAAIVDWEPHTPPTDLIFDDGEPLESIELDTCTNLYCRNWEYPSLRLRLHDSKKSRDEQHF